MMLHCFKKNIGAQKTASEICGVYGDHAVTVQTIHTWFRRFKDEVFSLEDRERRAQTPTTGKDLIKVWV